MVITPKNFVMDYSAMEALASLVSNLQREIDEMYSDMDSLVNSLDGQWIGKAQVEFTTSYKQLKPQIKEIQTTLEEFSNQIKSASALTQETDSNIKF